jgi:hypothetical protein
MWRDGCAAGAELVLERGTVAHLALRLAEEAEVEFFFAREAHGGHRLHSVSVWTDDAGWVHCRPGEAALEGVELRDAPRRHELMTRLRRAFPHAREEIVVGA